MGFSWRLPSLLLLRLHMPKSWSISGPTNQQDICSCYPSTQSPSLRGFPPLSMGQKLAHNCVCITVFARWSCRLVVAPHELMRCASSVTFSIRDDHCSVQSSSRLMSTPKYLYDSCSVMCGMLWPCMVSWGSCVPRVGPMCSAKFPPLRLTLV